MLCQRFFEPGTAITLTRLQAKTGDLVVGKGESVTLEITATGTAPNSARLFLHPAEGRDEVVVLEKDAKASGAGAATFFYTANSVTASFAYSALRRRPNRLVSCHRSGAPDAGPSSIPH